MVGDYRADQTPKCYLDSSLLRKLAHFYGGDLDSVILNPRRTPLCRLKMVIGVFFFSYSLFEPINSANLKTWRWDLWAECKAEGLNSIIGCRGFKTGPAKLSNARLSKPVHWEEETELRG